MSRTKHHIRGIGKAWRKMDKQQAREWPKATLTPLIDEDEPARGVGEGLSSAGARYMERVFGAPIHEDYDYEHEAYVADSLRDEREQEVDDYLDLMREQERAEREAAEEAAEVEWAEHLAEVFPQRDDAPWSCEEFRAHVGEDFMVRLPYIPTPLFSWSEPKPERVRVATIAREIGLSSSDTAEFLRTRMNEYVRDGRSTVVAPVADKALAFFGIEVDA